MGIYVVAFAKTGIHRVRREIDRSELTKLVLSSDEFSTISWIGKADFIYNDHVYDCETIGASKGKIIISCYEDREETGLKNVLAEHIEKDSDSSAAKTLKHTFKIFPVFPCSEKPVIENFNCSDAALGCITPDSAFSSPDRDIASPPPDKA